MMGPETAPPGAAATQADLLKPGDSVRIVVAGEQELSGIFPVAADGKVHLELLGDVPAAGLTADMLAVNLRQRLSAGYLRNPQVAVARAAGDEQMLRAGLQPQGAPAAGQNIPSAPQPVQAANLPPPPPPLQGSLGGNAAPAGYTPAPPGPVPAPVLRQSQDVGQTY
ncbi:MAG: polysaccharide biosynthesis/export family protein [Alphaproteobacteria bacterium]|nr:polysaccharide biosynthesis/export family protein [Alphaproteobacteria bacterium]